MGAPGTASLFGRAKFAGVRRGRKISRREWLAISENGLGAKEWTMFVAGAGVMATDCGLMGGYPHQPATIKPIKQISKNELQKASDSVGRRH